jgi:trimeric autotransporter adhesin
MLNLSSRGRNEGSSTRNDLVVTLLSIFLAVSFGCSCSSTNAWAATATTTNLTVTSGGAPVSTIASGNAITLTASVSGDGTPIAVGQVSFCDASAAYCTDIHLLGTAQLISNGTAILRFFPGIGSHSYKAVFLGNDAHTGSSSSVGDLNVTGLHPTTTAIAASGSQGNYTVIATVAGTSGATAPTGTMSFLDTSNSNLSLGAADLVAAGTDLTFLNSSNPTGSLASPRILVLADFNLDGKLDLAGADSLGFRGMNFVSIFLGSGDGTFTNGTEFANFYAVQSLAVGDFNMDGKPDIAAGYDHGPVGIFLGNGDGSFTSGPTVAFLDPDCMAVGDFNGDGRPDLIIGGLPHQSAAGFQVFKGNGDGTFADGYQIQTPNLPFFVTVADFNADGMQDLIVDGTGSQLTLFSGRGDGTFTALETIPVVNTNLPVAVADFTGDGKPDLAISDGTQTVSILLGKGDRTFTSGQSLSAGQYPSFVGSGDFNGDGMVDVAVANSSDSTATVFLGNGDGTFSAGTTTPTVGERGQFVTGDLNGDGIADLTFAGVPAMAVLTQSAHKATASVSGISPSGGGTHMVSASYPGDNSFSPSVSPLVSLSSTLTTYSLAATSVAPYANASSGTSTVTVSSINGYVGIVTLTCNLTASPIGAQELPTCIPGGSVTLSSSATSGTTTITVKKTPPGGNAATAIKQVGMRGSAAIASSVLFSLIAFWAFPIRTKHWKRFLTTSTFALVTVGTLSACGGERNKGGGGSIQPIDFGTSIGTYTFTVTGTGSDSASFKATTTFVLTVQK